MKYKKIVVKVGSSTIVHKNGAPNLRAMDHLARVISEIVHTGTQVLLVSSGAIAAGVGALRLPGKPADIPSKQAAAAVGQCRLMDLYEKFFTEYGLPVGQILLTRGVLDRPEGLAHVKNTVAKLLDFGVVPIVNENDTVAVDEIKIGDNDTLSAIVALIAEADLLVLLSDIDGLYDHDPHKGDATLIPTVKGVTAAIRAGASGSASAQGTGGMTTKLDAAEMVNRAGIPMVLASGEDADILYRIVQGEAVGTKFEV